MDKCTSTSTPIEHSLELFKATPYDDRCNQTLYQEIVGSLNHLALFSRPDVSWSVSYLSQFMSDPTELHLSAARHVLHYLQGTRYYRITYQKASSLDITGYVDADHGSNKNDRISFTGYLFKICGGWVSWTSHKQYTVANSTTVAEYMALSDAAREAEARSQLFNELGYKLTSLLLSDSQSALKIAEEPSQYKRIKHVDIRYHYIRHLLNNSQVNIDYVPGTENPADALTKALSPVKHHHCLDIMGFEELILDKILG